MELSVATLLEGALQDDAACWDQLVARFENLVWSVVRSFAMSDADSLDAAQMTWLRLVERLQDINEPDRLGSWLVTTARRECLRIVHRRTRTMPIDPIDGFRHLADPRDSLQSVHTRDELDRIFVAMKELSEKCRSLLRVVLCDPPPSYEQVAEALGLPVGTIGPRRQRCLAELRIAARVNA